MTDLSFYEKLLDQTKICEAIYSEKFDTGEPILIFKLHEKVVVLRLDGLKPNGLGLIIEAVTDTYTGSQTLMRDLLNSKEVELEKE